MQRPQSEQCSCVLLGSASPTSATAVSSPSLQSSFPGTTADPEGKLWGRDESKHIPSHCSVAELSLRVAWPRSLAAEWIAGTRGKRRWTEFGLWVQTSSSL